MDKWMDYYSILQVHSEADPEVVEATYRRLSKKYHPDVFAGPDATRRMQDINVAYDVLRDPQKRVLYHKEWINHNRGAFNRTSGTSFFSQDDYEEARRVTAQYFECLLSGLCREAYRLLSAVDRKANSEMSFLRWREAVNSLYRLVSFRVGVSKFYPKFELDGKLVRARRFSVSITEANLQTGETAEYVHMKLAVQDGAQWRVYLGYPDLDACARGLSRKAYAEAERGGTARILGREAFEARLSQEIYRKKRYRRPLSVGVIKVIARDASVGTQNAVDRQAEESIARGLRLTDAMGRCAKMTYAVLLGETQLSRAKLVVPRLCETLKGELSHRGVEVDIRRAALDCPDGDAEAFLAQALKNL